MRRKDFRKATSYFSEVTVDYYNLFTTAAVVFRNKPYFKKYSAPWIVWTNGLFDGFQDSNIGDGWR